MKLSDVMSKSVITIEKKRELSYASALMDQHSIGTLVILGPKSQKPGLTIRPVEGIITDRDLALAWETPAPKRDDLIVEDIMSTNIICALENDNVEETISKMGLNGVKRIPVLDEQDKLVGIVSTDDLLKILAVELQNLASIPKSEKNSAQGIAKTHKNGDLSTRTLN